MFLSIKRLANLRYSLCYDSIWLQPWQMSQRAVTFTLWLQRFRRKAAFGNSLLGFCFRIAMPQPQSFSHSWKSLIPWSTCRVESPLVSPQNALEWIFECWIDALHIQFFEFGALRKHLETHHWNVFKPPIQRLFSTKAWRPIGWAVQLCGVFVIDSKKSWSSTSSLLDGNNKGITKNSFKVWRCHLVEQWWRDVFWRCCGGYLGKEWIMIVPWWSLMCVCVIPR